MDTLLFEWITLLIRWAHIITAIAWIGASFYFVWLDMSLEEASPNKKNLRLQGELWAIHGGGIYEVQKYELAPPVMPKKLHWFKWEAYSTWLTGTALLVLVYYGRAQTYLVDDGSFIRDPTTAVLASIGFLISGVLGYELIVRRRNLSNQNLSTLVTLWLAFLCWVAFQLFSDRAATIHTGAVIASIMAANVFLGIIPGQRALVAAITSGEAVDPGPALLARKRSLHNNYLTLPVVLCMLANHFAFALGHSWSWLVVLTLCLSAAYARHFFNLKHTGRIRPSVLIISAASFLLVVAATTWQIIEDKKARANSIIASNDSLSSRQFQQLLEKHCTTCHAKNPSFPGYAAAPGGIIFENFESLTAYRDRAITSMVSGYMPLANLTELTETERAAMIIYLESVGSAR